MADIVAAGEKARQAAQLRLVGNGTSAHLSGAMLEPRPASTSTHVPTRGQAPALNDLLGGQVTMMFGNWPEFRQHVKAGKLIAWAWHAKRSAYAPEIAPLAEQGVALESNSWSGVLAPARGTDGHRRCGA